MTDLVIVSPRFIGDESSAALQLVPATARRIDVGPGEGDGIDRLAPIHKAVAQAVAEGLAAGQRPVIFVGDCCQTVAVMAGLARANVHPAVVWLDAHGDFNTWETTPSKFIGGMPLAMMTGRGDQRLMHQVGLSAIADRRVVLGDARDLDPGERRLVEESGIAHVALEKVVDVLPEGPLYLHIDTDVIDSRVAPAFLYPALGGPSAEAVRDVVARIVATGRVEAISICTGWDTERDEHGQTLRNVREAVSSLTP